MIAKGIPHPNPIRLARYLITAKADERAELWELRGFASASIVDAFRSVHVIAAATKCRNVLFHLTVRNRDGEHLDRCQWEYTAERIERVLGLDNQPRAVAFHIDNATGLEHMHVAWSRICLNTMKARPLPFFKTRLKKISRELERHFGFAPVPNERESAIKYAPRKAEEEQARRLGLDIHEVRETIRQCFDQSDCGRSFEAALAKQDLILAHGVKRDFVVLDHAGGLHALGKRILGISAAQIRLRLADLRREDLPSVEKGRAMILGRQGKKQGSANVMSFVAHVIPELEPSGDSEDPAGETERNADSEEPRMAIYPPRRGDELHDPQPASEAKPDAAKENVPEAQSEALPPDAQMQKRQSFAQILKRQFRTAMKALVAKSKPKESRKGSGDAMGTFRRVAGIICRRSAGICRFSDAFGFMYDTFAWLHAWIWNHVTEGDQIEANPGDSEQNRPFPHP